MKWKNYNSHSRYVVILCSFPENEFGRKNTNILMFVCTMVLYKYIKSLWNDSNNFPGNTRVWSIIYRKFYDDIVYTANEELRFCFFLFVFFFILTVLHFTFKLIR